MLFFFVLGSLFERSRRENRWGYANGKRSWFWIQESNGAGLHVPSGRCMYVLLLASMLFVNVSTYSLMIIQLFATPRLLQTSRRRSGEGQTVRPPTFFSSRPSNFFGKLLGLSRWWGFPTLASPPSSPALPGPPPVHTTLSILYTVSILFSMSTLL